MRTPTGTTQRRWATTLEEASLNPFQPFSGSWVGRIHPGRYKVGSASHCSDYLQAQGAWGKEKEVYLTQKPSEGNPSSSLHKDSYFSLPGPDTTSQSLELR